MKWLIYFFLLLLVIPTCLIVSSFAYTNPPSKEPPVEDFAELAKPAFRFYTEKDGLPSNNIKAVAFDQKGYLWIGTKDSGAAYYDGHKWTKVNMPNRLSSNYVVNTILPGSDGSLWFGTLGSGLYCLKDKQWTAYNKQLGMLPTDRIRYLLESIGADGRSILWVGTSAGLVKYENGQWTTFTTKNSGLLSDSIQCLLETKDLKGKRTLWIGTFNNNGGLTKYEDGQWTTFTTKNTPLPSDTIFSLLETKEVDGQPTLWVGTDGGLAKYQGSQWTIFTMTNSLLPSNHISALLSSRSIDGKPTLWIGAYSGGLVKYQDEKMTVFNTKNSNLPDSNISSMQEIMEVNGQRTLWLGTDEGLVKYQEGLWTSFDTKNSGLLNNKVYSFLKSYGANNQATLWFATQQGLTKYENGQWTTLTNKNTNLMSSNIDKILEHKGATGSATMWLALGSIGLAKGEAGKWTTFTPKNSGLPDDTIINIIESKDPNHKPCLWLATFFGGLVRYEYEEDKWTVFNTKNSALLSDDVYCLLETIDADNQATLWVGTYTSGLAKYKDGKWTLFNTKNSMLPTNSILSLAEIKTIDGRRTLWIGTDGGGVAYFNPDEIEGKWTILSDSTNPALPNNVVKSIFQDYQKRIYICTSKGVLRLTPRIPTAENLATFNAYTFTTEDGLPSNDSMRDSYMLDEQGHIWLGTSTGVAVLDTNKVLESSAPKPLLVKRILVNGKEYRKANPTDASNKEANIGIYGDLIDKEGLVYNQNNITFEYALLSYFKEKETLYQTQLVGNDEKPSEWTTENRQNFNNLAAGNYRFKVWGKDSAGNISGPLEVAFRVNPAWWFTWWAYFFYFAIITSAIYGFTQLWLRSLKQTNLLLENKIIERTAIIAEQKEVLANKNKELMESEKRAMEANRAKSTFLANMSHELRTPLNAILGFVQLMERMPDRVKADKEKLAIIMHSGEHLLGLINGVLSISKIEAGQVSLNNQVFNLWRLLDNLEEMFILRAQTKNILFEVYYDPKLPQSVIGDEDRLRQILINLLGNAFKFTDKGKVKLKVSYENDRAVFEVQDTGQGIDKLELTTLFQPFVQTQSGLNSKEGTGLGLAISRNLIQLMGGDIQVQSQLGIGSTFSFDVILPTSVVVEPVIKQQKVVGIEPTQQEYRLLVVDDIAEGRAFLAELLANLGFSVKQAANGVEAVEIWQEWHPQLIWMDMRMPIMDGNEATKLIRKKEQEAPYSNQPNKTIIIALTASSLEEDRATIIANGCDDFVLKPFKVELIFEKLAQKLGVKFIFEEEQGELISNKKSPLTEQLTSRRLASLPPTLLEQLSSAVIKGNVELAKSVAAQIDKYDTEVAQGLEIMIKSYKFEEIFDLVAHLTPDTSS